MKAYWLTQNRKARGFTLVELIMAKTATTPRPERPIACFMLHLNHHGDGR